MKKNSKFKKRFNRNGSACRVMNAVLSRRNVASHARGPRRAAPEPRERVMRSGHTACTTTRLVFCFTCVVYTLLYNIIRYIVYLT